MQGIQTFISGAKETKTVDLAIFGSPIESVRMKLCLEGSYKQCNLMALCVKRI